jgi:septal ring factor EnvC (AmiA/AmiB activator)
MARSGAERQKAYLHRQRDELITLRRRVHDLEAELAAANARIADSSTQRADEPRERRQERRLARYLYPSPRRSP